MKKIISLFLTVFILLTAASCGGGNAEVVLIPEDGVSPTALYSVAINMVQNPADYVGKSVQAEGNIIYSEDSSTGYYIRFDDGTGCCSVEMELQLAEGMEAPKERSTLRITGVISSSTNDAGTEVIRLDAETMMDQAELEKLYNEE